MNKPEVRSPYMNSIGGQSGNTKKISREDFAKQIQRMRDRDAELVTGIFKNLENPSTNGGRGSLMFGYKAYPNEELVFYELWDGERYTLPRGVARHLNNNCYYKEYQHLKGEFGAQGMRTADGANVPGLSRIDGRMQSQNMQMAKKIHRYAFHSLEYMDDDLDMRPSNLVEVTVSP